MKPDLSPTMQACVDYMKANSGEIVRHPGGFWANDKWTYHKPHHGTKTVDALVTRGIAEYTEWKDSKRKNRRFPVRARLTEGSTGTPEKPVYTEKDRQTTQGDSHDREHDNPEPQSRMDFGQHREPDSDRQEPGQAGAEGRTLAHWRTRGMAENVA